LEASRLFSDAASKENTEAQINFGDMLLGKIFFFL